MKQGHTIKNLLACYWLLGGSRLFSNRSLTTDLRTLGDRALAILRQYGWAMDQKEAYA